MSATGSRTSLLFSSIACSSRPCLLVLPLHHRSHGSLSSLSVASRCRLWVRMARMKSTSAAIGLHAPDFEVCVSFWHNPPPPSAKTTPGRRCHAYLCAARYALLLLRPVRRLEDDATVIGNALIYAHKLFDGTSHWNVLLIRKTRMMQYLLLLLSCAGLFLLARIGMGVSKGGCSNFYCYFAVTQKTLFSASVKDNSAHKLNTLFTYYYQVIFTVLQRFTTLFLADNIR